MVRATDSASMSQAQVENRLRLLNVLLFASAFVGVLGAWEIMVGTKLHEINFFHLKHNRELHIAVDRIGADAPLDTDRLRRIVTDIRHQPKICLELVGPFRAAAMYLAGGGNARMLCLEDLALADRTLAHLDAHAAGTLDRETLIMHLDRAVHGFFVNSAAFEPLVSRTVRVVFAGLLVILIATGMLLVLLGLHLSGRISQSFQLLRATRAEADRLSDQLSLIFNNVPVRVWLKDEHNRILRLNKPAATSMGLTVEEAEGADTYALFPEMAGKYHEDDLAVINANKARLGIVERYTPRDGEYGWVRTDKVPFVDSGGQRYILVVSSDITDQMRDKEALRLSEERLELAIEGASDGIWDWNMETDEVYYSPRNAEMLGERIDPRTHFFSWWEDRVHPEEIGDVRAALERHISERVPYDATYRICHADGHWRWWRSRGRALRGPDGTPIRALGTNSDVTELIEAQIRAEDATRAVEHEAMHDSLTGLPNRRYLNRELDRIAERRGQRSGAFAIAHIDLDRFKEINDTLGHAAGDHVLICAAKRLRSILRPGELAARIGGDEFVLVTENVTDEGDLVERARVIVAMFADPVPYEDKDCRVGASVGVALAEKGDIVPHRLLMNADLALYKAKERGRNGYALFDDALMAEAEWKKQTADDIVQALNRNEFVVHYEPQFDAKTLGLVGVEALARWQHPERGLLMPGAFLSVAEDLAVTPRIDSAIMARTLEDLAHLENRGIHVPKVSLNVSARRLADPDLLDNLPDVSGTAHQIGFELLETIFLDDPTGVTARNLEGLRRLGIHLEIDDFGTGHASVTSVMRVAPRRLKIDRTLIEPIVRDEAQRRIVKSIIDIGHTLSVEVLAEGVETREHARVLALLGCDALQGFAFSRTMALDELERFCREERWRAVA